MIRATITALCLVLPSLSLAQSQQHACYTLAETGDAAQPVDDLVITGSGDVTFTYAGFPQIPYVDGCNLEGRDHASCSLDCDAGIISLVRLPGGLLANFSRRIESARFESLTTAVGPLDATGQSLAGTYRLIAAPEAVCREMEERKPDTVLYAGLHFPGVAQLEAGLARAGYFNGVPDWSFTAETEEAVRAAQADLGFEVTGTVNRAFARTLANYAAFAYGGC